MDIYETKSFILGKEVKILVNEIKDKESYHVEFNAGNLASGVYFYCIKAGEYTQIKMMPF